MKNPLVFKLILRIAAFVAILACLFFIPARTLAWSRAWIYLCVMFVGSAAAIIYLNRTNHDLLIERSKSIRQKGQPLSDKIILQAFLSSYLGLMVFIPLDVFRFHLLPTSPRIVSALGLPIYLTGLFIVYRTFRFNPFAAPVVKLQSERGHHLIDTGPYRIVRHPMYGGAILVLVGPPLWLESYTAAIFEIIPISLLAIRCVLEEKFLCQNLVGYAQYMKQVRYRMIPFLW
jgi:protein-S-isoprenylcysteine O-methyltransferase Ste14